MKATYTGCVAADNAIPAALGPGCQVESVQRDGARVTWSMICTNRQNAVRSNGVAQYQGDRMEGTLISHLPQAKDGVTTDIVQRLTGRYLGACPAVAANTPIIPPRAATAPAGTTAPPEPQAAAADNFTGSFSGSSAGNSSGNGSQRPAQWVEPPPSTASSAAAATASAPAAAAAPAPIATTSTSPATPFPAQATVAATDAGVQPGLQPAIAPPDLSQPRHGGRHYRRYARRHWSRYRSGGYYGGGYSGYGPSPYSNGGY